jgi:hypothetical protein
MKLCSSQVAQVAATYLVASPENLRIRRRKKRTAGVNYKMVIQRSCAEKPCKSLFVKGK